MQYKNKQYLSLHPLSKDLDFILQHTPSVWSELRNQEIFITGGTGFFGCWLLESIVWANLKFNFNVKATILTRNISAFAKKCPHLIEQTTLQFIEGNVRDFAFPNKQFSHVIHAATDASADINKNQPTLMFDTIVEGTKRVLEFAKQCKARRFLLTSSGSVYGRQPPELTHIAEDYVSPKMIETNHSAYALGKYYADKMSCNYAEKYHFESKIARCFAFVGPYLPLDAHFAIGNFIRDGLNRESIIVNGDGTPYRSYLYAADLAVWLWTILIYGKSARSYNVGSEYAVSISELASVVASTFDETPQVNILKPVMPGALPERYIPNTQRAQNELRLSQRYSLVDSICATKKFAGLNNIFFV